MASLFISYAREDVAAAKAIAAALQKQGHDVWWDHRLAGGAEYSREIEDALDASEKVIVLWSAHSAGSSWVRDEATAARDAGKLVPLTIDRSKPPLGFRQFHTIDLADWVARPDSPLPPMVIESIGAGSGAAAAQQAEPQHQRIAFCRTPDGVRLAYSRVGDGPPMVKAANWLNHLEHEWENPLWRHWLEALSANHSLLRYDERGNGMSDWNVPDLSFERLVDDLVTVVDAAGVERFDLIGISQGSPVAVAFAARHPERVRKMVLINGFAAGWRHASDPEFVESWDAMSLLAKTGWGKNSAAFRQVFTSQFFPDATRELADWWNDLQKKSTNPENAFRFIRLFGNIDVRSLLPEVTVPTLVMHCREDNFVPFDAGRAMAARIPGAEFVALDSNNHLPLQNDAAWPKLTRELQRFLA